ncbi:TraB/GumN family protein [Enterobacteriaceae bacterium]
MSLFSRLHAWLSGLTAGSYPWPAIDITLPGGRHLHLVGSIHMGTRDMAPLPARLVQKIAAADALFVEADISGSNAPFRTPDYDQPLSARLAPELYARLRQRADELALDMGTFDWQPPWQVALVMQAHQAQRLGLRPDYGIDVQMIAAAQASTVPLRELEGTQSQMSLLETLPDEGLSLLEDTLTHWHTNARLLQLMVSWWLDAPPRQKNVALPATFGHELYDVLMHQRNRHWCEVIRALPPGRYVVAVGALHLYGEGNLPQLLRGG